MTAPAKVPVKAHAWARADDEWYVEPAWVTQRLCEAEGFTGRLVDPSAGSGQTVRGADMAGLYLEGLDLRDRNAGDKVASGHDFFAADWPGGICTSIISNPPYGAVKGAALRLEERFLELALGRTTDRVALFLRAGWLHSAVRLKWLRSTPLARVYAVVPRPSCPPGVALADGAKAEGGKTDYSWFVWQHGWTGPALMLNLER